MYASSLSSIFLASILILTVGTALSYVHADDEEIKIEIEIDDGSAEIKVEFDEDEYEFELGTSDLDEIISVIEIRTGLPRDLIEEVMKVEYEDDFEFDEDFEQFGDDEIHDLFAEKFEQKVQAEIVGEQVQVKVELEFFSDTTEIELIIEEIIDEFALTKEQADELLKIEEEDDKELEEKFEVEIEIEKQYSEVEVELRFVLDTTDRDEILDAIVEQTQISPEQIESVLDIDLGYDIESLDEMPFDDETLEDGIPDDQDPGNEQDSGLIEEIESLREENLRLEERIQILQQKIDDLYEIIVEQINVILDTLASLRLE